MSASRTALNLACRRRARPCRQKVVNTPPVNPITSSAGRGKRASRAKRAAQQVKKPEPHTWSSGPSPLPPRRVIASACASSPRAWLPSSRDGEISPGSDFPVHPGAAFTSIWKVLGNRMPPTLSLSAFFFAGGRFLGRRVDARQRVWVKREIRASALFLFS